MPDPRDILPAHPLSEVTGDLPARDRPAHKDPDHIGPFRIVEKIGEGGMGVVYKAEQREPVRRVVALKIIKLGMDTKEVVARFDAERQALAMLSHPNVARVFEAGVTDNGRPYFAMEHVPGIPLTKYCDESKLTTRRRLELFIPICQAVQHAHQKGIIHRDLKPTNILITLVDGKPVPKVIDFGIAKATSQALTHHTLFTQTGALLGTPEYMSPEQAMTSGLDVDTRTDIYSLGVILYELLTGTLPLDSKSLRAAGLEGMARLIKTSEPQKPSTRLSTLADTAGSGPTPAPTRNTRLLQKELRGDLDWIVLKAMEKDRARRYETANGLAADLDRHLNNEPVVARPPSTAYRIQKAFQRNRVAFTAAVVVAVALMAGIGLSTWQMVAARHARNNELQQRLAAQAAQQIADTQARKASESQWQSRRFLYASDMNLAQQTLKLNNLGRARRLLERHRPQPGEEDLRGWEWRYLWQLTRSSALVTLINRPVRGFSVSFSAEGTRLAVGWYDGRVDLWDVPGRRLVRALTNVEYRHQGRVAFSPVRNLLAATSKPRVVTLYDLDSGHESILWRAPEPDAWEVRDLAFSPDGSRLVIYAATALGQHARGDEIWVVNVGTAQVESHHTSVYSPFNSFGAARVSADHQRLYLTRSVQYRSTIQCIDLVTSRELWQTEPQNDYGLTTLDVSPDGRVIASGSGYEDSSIRIWDAATGRLIRQLDGHTGWVSKLVFAHDGRRMISAATDQTIRIWDTSNWSTIQVLRGHADEVCAVAVSEPGRLIASAGKDGNLMLWKDDAKGAVDGYRRLPKELQEDEVLPLDHSRVLMLPPGRPPGLVDLKGDATMATLPEIKTSADVRGWSGTHVLCHWNGTNQILVSELEGAKLVPRGAFTLDSGKRPTSFTFHGSRQLLAWTEGAASTSVFAASLTAPGRRIELRSDAPGLVPFRFSEDGNYLAALSKGQDTLRTWNLESGQLVASINESVRDSIFAAGGQVLVAAVPRGNDHEIQFYDLAHSDRAPRRVPGQHFPSLLAVSPDGGLVASATGGGLVRLFDPTKGESIESIQGHLNAVFGVCFSTDGRRLISTSGGREAVKVWDVGTRQELLTLAGSGSILNAAKWSADGDVILAGAPWQAWRAPSWEEIAAAEAKEKAETPRP